MPYETTLLRPLDDVLLHAVQVGSPPGWDDAPAEFQTDLAALDRLDDEALRRVARSHKTEADMERYQELLNKNANGTHKPASEWCWPIWGTLCPKAP